MPKILVHHLLVSRSDRVIWALEELGLPYEIKNHYRRSDWLPEETLSEASSMGKAPCVEIDGEKLAESAFIISTLLAMDAPNRSKDIESTPSTASTYWSHFAEGSLMLYLQPFLYLLRFSNNMKAQLPEDERKGANKLVGKYYQWSSGNAQRAINEAEAFLQKHQWFSGSDKLGQGDFMMFFGLNLLLPQGGKVVYKIGPAVRSYINRVRQRPAYKRGMKRAEDEYKAQRSKL